jgi:hypothetical protein
MTTMTSVTVRVPLTIRRRGGRKMIISPDGVATDARSRAPADIAVTRGDPALVKALARAFRWKRMLDDGRYGSIRELAKAENVNRAYVARLLNLTLLAPALVEAVLDGRQPQGMTLPALMEDVPPIWADQTAAWSGGPGRSDGPARRNT